MALPSQTLRTSNQTTWRSSGPRVAASGGTGLSFLQGRDGKRNLILVAAAVMGVTACFVWWRVARTPAVPVVTAGDTFLPTTGGTPGESVASGVERVGSGKPAVIGMADESTGGKQRPLDDLIAQAARNARPDHAAADPLETPIKSPSLPGGAAGGGVQPAMVDPMNTTPAVIPGNPDARPIGGSGAEASRALAEAERLVKTNQLVEARRVLNDAMMSAALGAADRGAVRGKMSELNDSLFFSHVVAKGDTITDEHVVASGETLARIVRRQGLPIDWRLLVRVNRLANENAIRVGQTIKVVRMPLHAVVHKNDYRMDIYAGPPSSGGTVGPDGQESGWTYIRSFRVGLGESNGTPEGAFVVKTGSKLVNPKWVNPRTGEVFLPDNPNNPIGERWIGLEGVDEATRKFTGYGIHGTTDAGSIGQQKSMGCVRLAAGDVEMVYEMLIDRLSTVKIVR